MPAKRDMVRIDPSQMRPAWKNEFEARVKRVLQPGHQELTASTESAVGLP